MTIQCGFTPNFVFLGIFKTQTGVSRFEFIKENLILDYSSSSSWYEGFKIVNGGFYVQGNKRGYQNSQVYGYNWVGYTHFYLALKFT